MADRSQGGRVEGTVVGYSSLGPGIPVAKSCFDPGYDLDTTFQGGDKGNRMSQADLVRGFVATGRLVGNNELGGKQNAIRTRGDWE